MQGIHWFEILAQDLRYSFRTLKTNPGFGSVAILTLALGIGANTAIFSLLYAVELRRLPVHDPEQLVQLEWSTNKQVNWRFYTGYTGCDAESLGAVAAGCSFSYPMFDHLRLHSKSFDGLAAVAGPAELQARIRGEVVRTNVQFVSGEFFTLMGVDAKSGRTLDVKDDLPQAEPVAVLNSRYWEARFASDPTLIGKTIAIEGTPFTIIGIAPPEFFGLQPVAVPDLWIPVHSGTRLSPGWWRSLGQDNAWLYVIGRLKAAVPLRQARAELGVLLAQTSGFGDAFKPGSQTGVALSSIAHGLAGLRRMYSEPLHVIMAVMGLVLLIACINLAHLLLARASVRRKEVAIRLAMGAGRYRLWRQLLTESIVLSVLGSIAGLLLALWLSRALAAFLASRTEFRILLDVHPSPAVLAFTMAVTALVALLLGLAPALASTRVEPAMALNGTAGMADKSSGAFGGHNRLRRVLVAGETALALVLLIGAGLFIRTLINLEALDPGFRKDHLVTFQVSRPHDIAPSTNRPALNAELRARLAALPGVQSATWSSDILLIGNLSRTSVFLEGGSDTGPMPVANLRIGPNYFETIGIPILAGRTVKSEDCRPDPATIWINRTLAQRYLPNENPIGRVIVKGKSKYQIAGVVGDAKYQTLRSAIDPTIYVPVRGDAIFMLRTTSDGMIPEGVVRQTVHDVAPNLIAENIKSEVAQIDEHLFTERTLARLSTVFGLLALALAAIGVYGVITVSIAHRTREIAIRISLGAMPSEILRMVLADGLLPVLAGAFAGLLISWSLTRLLSSFLFGVKALDTLTYISAIVFLLVIAGLACYIPARRTTHLDPNLALRYE